MNSIVPHLKHRNLYMFGWCRFIRFSRSLVQILGAVNPPMLRRHVHTSTHARLMGVFRFERRKIL